MTMNPIHLFHWGEETATHLECDALPDSKDFEEILSAKKKRCKEISGGTVGVQRSSQDEGQEAGMRTRLLFSGFKRQAKAVRKGLRLDRHRQKIF
jgi:hypothetical protein